MPLSHSKSLSGVGYQERSSNQESSHEDEDD